MNIWIVNQHALPPSEAGATRHFSLVKPLVQHGDQVTILGANISHLTRKKLFPGSESIHSQTIEGVHFVWLNALEFRGNDIRRVLSFVNFFMQVWREEGLRGGAPPDIILGSSGGLFGPLAAQRLASRYKVPFILEVRDLWPQTLIDLGHFPTYHPYIVMLGLIERYLYRNANHIITLLPKAHDYIASKGGNPQKITWIPNGIDLSMVPAPAPAPSGSVFTITYAGGHGLANNLSVLLDAAQLIERDLGPNRVHFRLIGDGTLKPALQQSAQEKGLQSVTFEPPMPKETLYSELVKSDAFFVSGHKSSLYKYGTSMNKLPDYLACARPILYGMDETENPIQESGAGFNLPADDPAAVRDAVKQLLAMSPEARWEMGLRGRKYAEEHYDTQKLGLKLEAITRLYVKA